MGREGCVSGISHSCFAINNICINNMIFSVQRTSVTKHETNHGLSHVLMRKVSELISRSGRKQCWL